MLVVRIYFFVAICSSNTPFPPKTMIALLIPESLKKEWIDQALSYEASKPRPYQNTVIEHAQHMNRKGITPFKGCLVWHTMGTGKTLTGLNILKNALAENKADRGGWTNLHTLLQNPGDSNSPLRFFETFESMATVLRGKSVQTLENDPTLSRLDSTETTLVVDEAQHIVTIMRDSEITTSVREWFYNRLRKVDRIILLTGTPLYYSTMDFSFLINLCSNGREPLLPFEERQFHQEYYSIHRGKAFLHGWILPIIDLPIVKYGMLIFTGAMMTNYLVELLGFFSENTVVIDGVGMYSDAAFESNRSNSTANTTLRSLASVFGLGEKYDSNEASGIVGTWLPAIGLTAIFMGVVRIFKNFDLGNIYVLNVEKLGETVGGCMSYYTHMPIGRVTVKTHLKNTFKRIKSRFRFGTTAKVAADEKAGKSKDTTRHYKTTHMVVKKLHYNKLQSFLFLDFTTGIVPPEYYKAFGYTNKHPAEADDAYHIFSDTIYDSDNFATGGCVIGNLPLEKKPKRSGGSRPGTFQGSFFELLNRHPGALGGEHAWHEDDAAFQLRQVDPERRSRHKAEAGPRSHQAGGHIFSRSRLSKKKRHLLRHPSTRKEVKSFLTHGNFVYPLKFLYILVSVLTQRQRGHKAAQVCVYSMFEEYGTAALKAFISLIKPGTDVPDPEDIDKTYRMVDLTIVNAADSVEVYDVLLIPPQMTEGLNLKTARELHIMEPLTNPSKLDQVKARVNRYSKEGYSEEEKDVTIFLYICSARKQMHYIFDKMKHWNSGQNTRGRIFWKRYKKFDQDISPDCIAYSKYTKQRREIAKISRQMAKCSRLNHSIVDEKDMRLIEDPKQRAKCPICGPNKQGGDDVLAGVLDGASDGESTF